MCKLVIVGHGNFPSGVLSAVSLLVGNNENICAFDLDKNETHEGFEQKIKELLDNNDKVIVVSNDKRKAFEEELYLKMDYSLERI